MIRDNNKNTHVVINIELILVDSLHAEPSLEL